jgi:thiamine biosynthesis protein ThiS
VDGHGRWTGRALPFYNGRMKIFLNGQDFELPDGATVASLVAMRRQSGHLRTPAYAVERNKDVVLRAQHEATRLQPGDQVEIVVMVGGG